jgi:hypothetical protein
MILYNAEDIRIGTGTEEVLEVRAGSDLVWSRNQFWTFSTPAAGTELRVKANWVSGDVTINWGDGSSDALAKLVPTNHIYG